MRLTIKLMLVLVSITIGVMTPFLPVPAVAGDQVKKMTGSIDIASIINFSKPETKSAGPVSQAGMIASTDGNPSVVISNRSQAPSDEWGRYRMESSTQGWKEGILAGGVMAALRIAIR